MNDSLIYDICNLNNKIKKIEKYYKYIKIK